MSNTSRWIPHQSEFSWEYFLKLIEARPEQILLAACKVADLLAHTLGNSNVEWWARLLTLGSQDSREKIETIYNQLSPNLSSLDLESPTLSFQSSKYESSSFDLEAGLREICIEAALAYLGVPDLLLRTVESLNDSGDVTCKTYAYDNPNQEAIDWYLVRQNSNLTAYWYDHQVEYKAQCHRYSSEYKQKLIGPNVLEQINLALEGKTLLIKNNCIEVGFMTANYQLADYDMEVQAFSQRVKSHVEANVYTGALAEGKMGTGKTEWTKSFVKEVLNPLGFCSFILDSQTLDSFKPLPFLKHVALIINEVDNLILNREYSQRGDTENLLSMLDGSLHGAIQTSEKADKRKFVTLLTCNTSSRMDPTVFRKGRVAERHTFTKQYDESTNEVEALQHSLSNGKAAVTS